MKKLLLITVMALFATVLAAQNRTILFDEDFYEATMPAGWTIMGDGTENWSISHTSNAGGSANELFFNDVPSFDGLSRFVSPAVDLTDVSSVLFEFKHYCNIYQGPHTLGVATSSDDGETWHEAWTFDYDTTGQYAVSEEIATEDFGKHNVRFCIFYSGNSFNINNWYFDNIFVTSEGAGFGIGHPEHFDGAAIPAGWSIKGKGTSNWSISETANAGGSANEIKLSGTPNFNGITRLVSPAVDLTGFSSVVFEFKHIINIYSEFHTHTLGIATSSDNGETWHDAWSEVFDLDGQYSVSEVIATEDIGKPNVRFCIYYSGNTAYLSSWYFDDIALNEYHVGLSEVEANSYNIFPNPANGSVKVLASDDIQTLSIYNAVGALVDRINVGANNAEINTTKYNSGVYFINVMQTNGTSITKRLVITH